MGAVQSDLKASIVQASCGEKIISPTEDVYWATFWERPETTEHVFETFTATDIRSMRDNIIASSNFKTLILKVTCQLLRIRSSSTSLSEINALYGTRVLNCIRILTRVLPYVYEAVDYKSWEKTTFWQPLDIETCKQYESTDLLGPSGCLGRQLISTLTDLLFYSGFTLPWPDAAQPSDEVRPSYGLWQSGIACDTTVATNHEYESRRTEIMQLLLTMQSRCIYQTPVTYIATDTEAITCLVHQPDRKRIQALLCSLLNTIIKFQPESWLPFDPRRPQGDLAKEKHVKTCLHFLLVNMLNRAPSDEGGQAQNDLRQQFSFLHAPKHFQFLADGIAKVLRQPLDVGAAAHAIGQRQTMWAPEMLLLLWEAILSNRNFLSYIIDTGRALDYMVLLIYYARQSQMEGIGRVCIFCLHTISAAKGFARLLDKPFQAQSTLPACMQIKNFQGRYSDYLILSVLALLDGGSSEATPWSLSLATIISNVMVDVSVLAKSTSTRLVRSLVRRSKPSFVLSNDVNLTLTTKLLEAVNTMLETEEKRVGNEALLYALWRTRDQFETLQTLGLMDQNELRSVSVSAEQLPISPLSPITPGTPAVSALPSEKIQGKKPSMSGAVTETTRSKLATMPVYNILQITTALTEMLSVTADLEPLTPADISRRSSIVSLQHLSSRERSQTQLDIAKAISELGPMRLHGSTEHRVEPFQFEINIAALYASYYWGLVVLQDMQNAPDAGRGIWFGTGIKLFGIQTGQAQGPSLWSPRGAVDAVGESLYAGVRDLTIRAKRSISSESYHDR